MSNQNWYEIKNIHEVDSPALVIYTERVKENIKRLVFSINDVSRLRPHIKTHKSSEVTGMMLDAGISKFKCATIAEAEMLASSGAKDILLAYQPVGPKAIRLLELVKQFPTIKFSCLIDNFETAQSASELFEKAGLHIEVYIDLNVGMNRTGIAVDDAMVLLEKCIGMKGIKIIGLHAYDGHIRNTDFDARKKVCDEAFSKVEKLKQEVEQKLSLKLRIVAGGTPTYSVHSKRNKKEVECSPGTYVYWDRGYEQILQEQHYLHGALVITRVISKPSSNIICVDLGHKAIASENTLTNRVFFLNGPELEPIGHSEEHMVLKTNGQKTYQVGDILYGVPYHVCPTVALHDRPAVVENGEVTSYWNTLSRNRKITI